MVNDYVRGSFQWALKVMASGNKVRRPVWFEKRYLFRSGIDIIFDDDKQGYKLHYQDYEATDWCFYDEKKSLSDKQISTATIGIERYYHKDVKQALKEYFDWMKGYEGASIIRLGIGSEESKRLEIFGEDLL